MGRRLRKSGRRSAGGRRHSAGHQAAGQAHRAEHRGGLRHLRDRHDLCHAGRSGQRKGLFRDAPALLHDLLHRGRRAGAQRHRYSLHQVRQDGRYVPVSGSGSAQRRYHQHPARAEALLRPQPDPLLRRLRGDSGHHDQGQVQDRQAARDPHSPCVPVLRHPRGLSGLPGDRPGGEALHRASVRRGGDRLHHQEDHRL